MAMVFILYFYHFYMDYSHFKDTLINLVNLVKKFKWIYLINCINLLLLYKYMKYVGFKKIQIEDFLVNFICIHRFKNWNYFLWILSIWNDHLNQIELKKVTRTMHTSHSLK